MMKMCFYSQNIVGAEYIVCTHWLNIVGAAAPTVGRKMDQISETCSTLETQLLAGFR